MLTPTLLDIGGAASLPGLAARILAGDIAIVRQGLQQAGLLDDMIATTLEGVRAVVGGEISAEISRHGFDRIHEWGDAATLPAVTEAVYDVMARHASPFLDRLVARLFPSKRAVYFERNPNVRFHIPYDRAGDRIVCPWHNLPFDPDTGASPCAALRPWGQFAARVDRTGGKAHIRVEPSEGGE